MGLCTAQNIDPSTSQESLDYRLGSPRDTGEIDVTLEQVFELPALMQTGFSKQALQPAG